MREGFGMPYVGCTGKSQQEDILSLLISDLPPKCASVTAGNEPPFPAGFYRCIGEPCFVYGFMPPVFPGTLCLLQSP